MAVVLAIAGMSVQVAGFAGLLAALRRSGRWKPIDVYRLRQIPEIGIATALLAVAYFPLAELTSSSAVALRTAAALAVIFTAAHVVTLFFRGRTVGAWWASRTSRVTQILIDVAVFVMAGVTIIIPDGGAFELLLAILLARQMLAFVLVLTDLASGGSSGDGAAD